MSGHLEREPQTPQDAVQRAEAVLIQVHTHLSHAEASLLTFPADQDVTVLSQRAALGMERMAQAIASLTMSLKNRGMKEKQS